MAVLEIKHNGSYEIDKVIFKNKPYFPVAKLFWMVTKMQLKTARKKLSKDNLINLFEKYLEA